MGVRFPLTATTVQNILKKIEGGGTEIFVNPTIQLDAGILITLPFKGCICNFIHVFKDVPFLGRLN
jgi:hypothetical protein